MRVGENYVLHVCAYLTVYKHVVTVFVFFKNDSFTMVCRVMCMHQTTIENY